MTKGIGEAAGGGAGRGSGGDGAAHHDELFRRVDEAIRSGVLYAGSTPQQIRAYLRQQVGVTCTPIQARAVASRIEAGRSGVGPKPHRGETLGERLLATRQAKLLSRGDLAEIVGCSASHLSYLETGARSPSPDMLAALAQALSVEAAWLQSGHASQTTRRIADLITFCGSALRHNELDQVQAYLDELTDEQGLGRPLHSAEADQVAFLKARLLDRSGRSVEAVDAVRPLVQRALTRDCAVDPVQLGQVLLQAVIWGTFPEPDRSGRLREAIAQAGRLLLANPDRPRDDFWWRLAATIVQAKTRVGSLREAALEAESWLAEATGPTAADPQAPSGIAGLRWNLSSVLVQLGRLEEALGHIEAARQLHDSVLFPLDGTSLELEYANILMQARPHRVAEAIALLDALSSGSTMAAHMDEYAPIRSRAELIAGRAAQAEAMALGPARSAAVPARQRIECWLIVGDARAGLGRLAEAAEAYQAGANLVESVDIDAGGMGPAWYWRALGDRWLRLGRPDAANVAYRHALDRVDVREGPGLPPYQTPGRTASS